MSRASDRAALQAFVADAPARIARLARSDLAKVVPAPYQAAAQSVARQASGGWTVKLRQGSGFGMVAAMREFELGRDFAAQCGFVVEMVASSRIPELVSALSKLGSAASVQSAVMASFSYYFVAHEFLHVEQGLGSDQYQDSDFYMPVVMEADYVADVAGLVVVLHAGVPELAALTRFETLVVLIAIHIASMHSFQRDKAAGLDFFAFTRLVLWYLHFSRIIKAGREPALDAPSFQRSWVVTFPRLVGRADQTITRELLAERALLPLAASSDIVLAFHADDGLYRIHRAALTDADRTRRLCEAVLAGRFDQVRVELEELLVNNPGLVPARADAMMTAVTWASGLVLDLVERLPTDTQMVAAPLDLIDEILIAKDRLVSLVLAARPHDPVVAELLDRGGEAFAELRPLAESGVVGAASGLRRRLVSLVDQIVLAVFDQGRAGIASGRSQTL